MLGDQMEEESVEKNINDLELNSKPEYVDMDRKDREAFLSQVGNFSTEERGIFNQLCDNWDYEIGYAKFVTTVNKKQSLEEKELISLMKKLRKSCCGIVLRKFNRGERGVEKLILTDVYSHHFFYYFIEDEYQKNYEDVSKDFVDDKRFDKYDISTSELKAQPLNLDDINKRFIATEANLYNVYKVKVGSLTPFYITSQSLNDLIKLSVRKIKYYFKSDNFIAFIAKIMNTSISKVRTTIDRFEIATWKTFTKDILASRSIIDGKFKNISESFFKALYIINCFSTNELKLKDEELKQDKKIREILRELVNSIREKEFTPLSQEGLNSLFTDYTKEFPSLKTKFYESYVDNKSKTGLTEIVFIGKHYIHQDNLYKIFLDRVGIVTTELTSFYIDEYKKGLHNNSSDPSLLEGYPFNGSVMTKIEDDYPIVYGLLNRKNILAESIIHFSKKRGHSQSKMHNLLSQYFVEGTSELKNVSEIFNLDVLELYDAAYSRLPFLKRFTIVLFGRYTRYLERFTGHKKIKRKKAKKIKKNKRVSNYSSSSSSRDYYPSRGKSLIKESSADEKSKHYTKSERDNAWSNLGDELFKKK